MSLYPPAAHCAHRRCGLNRLYPGTPGARVYNWVRGSKVTPGCGTARKYVAIFSQTSQGRWPYLLTLPSVCLHLYNPPICTKTAGTMGNALNRVVMSVGLPAPSTVAAITLLHARFTCWATQMSWWIDFFSETILVKQILKIFWLKSENIFSKRQTYFSRQASLKCPYQSNEA